MTGREETRRLIRERWEELCDNSISNDLDTMVTYWGDIEKILENSKITIETEIPFSLTNGTANKERHIKE